MTHVSRSFVIEGGNCFNLPFHPSQLTAAPTVIVKLYSTGFFSWKIYHRSTRQDGVFYRPRPSTFSRASPPTQPGLFATISFRSIASFNPSRKANGLMGSELMQNESNGRREFITWEGATWNMKRSFLAVSKLVNWLTLFWQCLAV